MFRAVDKEFNMCGNYPKRRGELFCKWIENYHPGALLLHVERSSGSHQYLDAKGTIEVYMNYSYWTEFLDYRIRTPGDNILQESIFIILSSLEMMVLARLCDIIHITICLPTCWLTGNCHILAYYNWCVSSMRRMVDELETSLETIEEE